jgi:DNA-directed RNA polymerase specialized sigma24 family protein
MRSIADAHFTQNYNYYRTVCRYQFKGNYLYEDLLQETYIELLRVKPETIEFYSEIGKLNCIVIKIIKHLHSHRRRRKYHHDGHTSQLFETADIDYSNWVESDEAIDQTRRMPFDNELNSFLENFEEVLETENRIQRQFDQARELMELAKLEPVKYDKGSELSDFLKIKVFEEVNKSSVNRVHKDTGISRAYLTRIYREGKEYLQKNIK